MKSSINNDDLYLLKDSNIEKPSNCIVTTKKRRRKTVETTIETNTAAESIISDVNKIRLSKSDETFDLKLQSNDQIVPINSHELPATQLTSNEKLKFDNFNELKLYKQIDVSLTVHTVLVESKKISFF